MSIFDKLPKLPFLSKSEANYEYFFALNITKSNLSAAVWGIENGKLQIINTSKSEYSSEEDLADAANFCLDEALADFSYEPSKILFGVPEPWLQDDNLKPEHLKFLKHLVKELDVEPLAYVSNAHAISHLLQNMQGVPLTAILVEVTEPLAVTVVKAGKIVGSKWHKRTGNLPEDIEKALLGFTDIEVLPSKILIYGPIGAELDKYKEELLSFSWMSQLPFLHLPKVEILDPAMSIEAVCFAGASELEPNVSYSKSSLPHQGTPETITTPAKDFASDFKEDANGKEITTREPQTGLPTAPVTDQPYKESALIDKIKANLRLGLLKNKFLLIPILVLALLIGMYIFLPKAKVMVFVDMQLLEKAATVTADPAITQLDEANKKIPGKVVETSVDGSMKAQATGKKKVGDAAKGSVVLFNKTNSTKTFTDGTVLLGPNSLKFKLDSSVNVASQSAQVSGIQFGRATANVTALDIGPDGNLPAGKELTVEGQSSSNFSAVVDQAFSGGVSKDVTVVTADDQKKLLAALISDLRKKAKDQLQSKLQDGFKISEEALGEQILKQTYSKNINDQAAEFSLTVQAHFKGTAYNENDLKLMVSKLVETNVPQGFELDLSNTETQADVAKVEKDGKVIFSAKFRAKLMPKLDKNQIKKDLVFKSSDQVAKKLKEINNVIGSNIEINPSLPGPLQRMPILSSNISVEVTAK